MTDLRFESDVISDGTQTMQDKKASYKEFESDVISIFRMLYSSSFNLHQGEFFTLELSLCRQFIGELQRR